MATLFTAIMALHSSVLIGKGFLQQLAEIINSDLESSETSLNLNVKTFA
jgi:hypothetical protein